MSSQVDSVFRYCGHCKTDTMQINNTTSSTGARCTTCGTWNEFQWSLRYPAVKHKEQ